MQRLSVSFPSRSTLRDVTCTARRWLVGTAVVVLSACGGGGSDNDPTGSVPVDTTAPATGPAVRVEVEPAALLLTAAGQQQRLTVQAFDREGRVVASAVTWQASRPGEVDVASDGTVRAAAALGSGQVVAVVDGVRSAPVVVAVGEPAAGVLLLTDAQIASDPVAVDPLAEPSIDNEYSVLLTGVPAPAVGSLLLGREGKSIGGEVLASTPEVGGARVRLKVVPIEQLMRTAQIREEIDLSGLPLQIPADIAALYEVRVENDEYIFTPRPGASSSAPRSSDRKRPLLFKSEKFGPFTCELAGSELPISLSQPTQFSLKFVPSYVVDYERGSGLKRLLFRAEATFKLKTSLQLNASLLTNLTCEATLVQRLVPLPGVAGLILGSELQAGIGFETEGSIAIPLLGVEFNAEVKGKMEAGVDCTSGGCRMVSDWKPEANNTLRLITPAGALANARTEFFLFGYGFGKMRVGLTLVGQARVEAVKVRGGVKFETTLAPEATQLAPVDAGQPDYRSDYKLHALAEVTAGGLNKGDSAFRALLQKLGIFKITLLKLQLSVPLAESPKGTVSFGGADVARDGEFVDGKTLSFNVKLDPKTARFPVLGYNVKRVLIFYTANGVLPREVARIDAKDGQTEFDLTWVAEGTAGASGRGFVAFVDTAVPLPASLELGKAQQVPDVMTGRLQLLETTNFREGTTGLSTKQVDADVELRAPAETTMRLTRLAASGAVNFTSIQTSPFGGPDSPCSYNEQRTFTQSVAGAVSAPSSNDVVFINLDLTAGTFVLREIRYTMPQRGETVFSRSFSGIRGDCTGFALTDTSERQPIVFDSQNRTPFFSADNGSAPITGPIVTGPDGKRSLAYSGQHSRTASQSLLTQDVRFELKEGPSKSASTNLGVAIVATPTVKPLGTLTYSVNLQNLGVGPATEVRAEFTVPPGWGVIGRVGWSGCSVSQTTVTCRTDTLAVGEQRAFLVDVRAPEALGLYTIAARVSAAEIDTDFSDNRAETTSTIVE